MLDNISDRFVLIRTTTRVFAVTFVVFFTLTAFVPLQGQSQLNSAAVASEAQDANSGSLNSVVPQESSTTDATEQLTIETPSKEGTNLRIAGVERGSQGGNCRCLRQSNRSIKICR